jgi:hypothetical protein
MRQLGEDEQSPTTGEGELPGDAAECPECPICMEFLCDPLTVATRGIKGHFPAAALL